MVRLSFFYLLIVLGVASCQQMEEFPSDLGLEYQPLEVGLTWTYQVDETIYFGENDRESDNYFLKDHVFNSYQNEAEGTVYIIQRSKSSNRSEWKNTLTYSLRRENNFLLRKLDNEIIIPLKFPVQQNSTWDGNLFNTHTEDLYMADFVNRHPVGQLNFNNVVRVEQETQDDLITIRDNRYEYFAKGVGLIESYYEVLGYCSRNDCLGEQIIESGRLTHIKLLSYDKL